MSQGVFDKIRRCLALADRVFQVDASDASDETKYDLVFSDDLSRALDQLFRIDYCDPDSSYAYDLQACVGALRSKCGELRRVLGPGPAERPS